MKPFRFWCQKVLPLVFDDSLSYYEVLCKMGAKINEIIQYITDGLEEALKDFFPDAMYDAENERIRITVGEEEPVDNGEKVKSFQVGDKIISIDVPTNELLKDKKILVVCDDLANATAWSNYFITEHGASAVDITNIGQYGYASANETDPNVIINALDARQDIYDYVLLFIGQRDYIQQVDIGNYSDYGDAEVKSVAAGAGRVANYCNTKFTKAKTCLATPMPNRTGIGSIGQYGSAGGGQYRACSLAVYRLMLTRIAKHYGLSCIDCVNAPDWAPWQTTLYNRWVVQPSSEPYCCQPNDAYAPILAKFLATNMVENSQSRPAVTIAKVIDHLTPTSGNQIFNYTLNEQNALVAINFDYEHGTENGLVAVHSMTWPKCCRPRAASYYIVACKSTDGNITYSYMTYNSAANEWRLYVTVLQNNKTYNIFGNFNYEISIGTQA